MNDLVGSSHMTQGRLTNFTTDRFGNSNSALNMDQSFKKIFTSCIREKLIPKASTAMAQFTWSHNVPEKPFNVKQEHLHKDVSNSWPLIKTKLIGFFKL